MRPSLLRFYRSCHHCRSAFDPYKDLSGYTVRPQKAVKKERDLTQKYKRIRAEGFVDDITVRVSSGHGGRGAVSFGREANKRIAPPDGAAGGKGGDVYVQAHNETLNLKGMSLRFKAAVGGAGSGGHRQGANGKDLFLKVPRGCLITEVTRFEPPPDQLPTPKIEGEEEEEAPPVEDPEETAKEEEKYKSKRIRRHLFLEQPHLQVADPKPRPFAEPSPSVLVDTSTIDAPLLILRGGRGGRGNASYASAENRSPMQYQPGGHGEDRSFRIEYKLLADVGLVGFPNAGKSSLLNALTRSKQKIGYWPFTTIRPSIGMMLPTNAEWQRELPLLNQTMEEDEMRKARALRIADIPGIIEGASQNVGLGHAFLRHIQKTQLLLFVVDLASEDPLADLAVLRKELFHYDPTLLQRDWFLIGNKVDAIENDTFATYDHASFVARFQTSAMSDAWQAQSRPKAVLSISTLALTRFDELRDAIWQHTRPMVNDTEEDHLEEIE